jgi:N-formylglutamate amidohydrolase
MNQEIPGVLSVEGHADQSIPLVLDSPHSGTHYPSDFAHQADPALLRQAEDTHVHTLWRGALASGAVLLHAHFPRAYVDANRAADDIDPAQIEGDYPEPLRPSVKSRLGIGLCWTRVPPEGGPMYARPLTAGQILARVQTYHRPYHRALRGLLDTSRARWGAVWHINCHSMQNHASAMSTQPRGTTRPDFVLGDRDGTSCDPAFTQAVADFLGGRGYHVTVNDPYKGMELIRANGDPAQRRHSMQIEVNRRLYMDEITRLPHDGFDALQSTFTALAAHLASHIATQLHR